MTEQCDICLKEGADEPNDATYDAPLKGIGSWAYVCADHEYLADTGRGTSLAEPEYDETATPTDDVPTVAVPMTLDSIAEVSCPTCGRPRNVEPDARYTVECEGCGQNYQLNPAI